MWYEIKIKADELVEEAINSILYEMDASGILTQNSQDLMFQEGYEGDWDYFGIDLSEYEEGFFIKAYVEFESLNEQADEGKNGVKPRIDYKCMSREITTLSGETDFTKVSSLYQNIENWIIELKKRVQALGEFGFDVSNVQIEYFDVPDIDYVNKWKEEYRPFEIGEDIVICPTWLKHELVTDKFPIFIDPGNAFGSGTHESTMLCISLMDKYKKTFNLQKMYDVGCGSGILSIVGHKLGFEEVVGIDIDEDAIIVSEENAKFNEIELDQSIRFVHGNLLEKLKEPADLVVANIIADVIISMSEDLQQIVKSGGYFIGSGIINERLEEVKQALEKNAFEMVEIVTENEWSALICTRK